MTALSWTRRGAMCGECGHAVTDDDGHCPNCRQSTGPFQPVAALAMIVADPAGGMRLHVTHTGPDGPTSTTRALTAEQAKALGRPWATPGAWR